MKIDKTLYLPIEILERELDAKLLLAVEAINRGYTIYIGHYSKMKNIALNFGEGVYLYKAMTDYNAKKLFSPLKAKSVKCVVLDEEGLVWPSLEYYGNTRIQKGDSLKVLDKVFTWGKKQKDWLVENYNIEPEKVVVTGNPRFDILKKNLRVIYEEETRSIQSSYGDFILVNTNFGPANFSKVFGRTWLEHIKWAGICSSNESLSYYKRREQYYRSLMREYSSALKLLAARVYPVKIIVRPHPSENHDTWRQIFDNSRNILVEFSGSSKPWINAAKCVVHTGCTTGIESFALNVPVIRFNPLPESGMESPLPNKVSYQCSSYINLEKAVLKILSNEFSDLEGVSKKNILQDHLYNFEGQQSFIAIMDEIDRISTSSKRGRGFYLSKYRLWLKILKSRAIKVVSGILLKVPYLRHSNLATNYLLRKQRFSGVSKKTLLHRYKMISEVVGGNTNSDISCEIIDVDVYRLSKE